MTEEKTPNTCAYCSGALQKGHRKFCSRPCAVSYQVENRTKKSGYQQDEERLGPLCFASTQALREYLGMDRRKPAKYVSKTLAEAEAVAALLPPVVGPTAAQLREEGYLTLWGGRVRQQAGPRTEEP